MKLIHKKPVPPRKHKKTGRKLLQIDVTRVREMARDYMPMTEIAREFGVDEGTIRKRFSDIIEKERTGTRRIIRKTQIRLAKKGDRTMLVWLGKQFLGQTDKQNVELTGANQGPIKQQIQFDYDSLKRVQDALLGLPATNGASESLDQSHTVPEASRLPAARS